MTIFLFIKQFVDMLYQYQILDYGMVIFAIGLIAYKFFKEKMYIDFKRRICIEDAVITGLAVIFFASFCRNTSFYGVFFKVLSAFLIYYLGRVYGFDKEKYGKWLSLAGYLVIYSNFIYRCYLFGWKLFVSEELIQNGILDTGAFYYYKTDLAVGIIISSAFVYAFSKIKYLKWFTVWGIAGYMVFYSYARTAMILLVAEYLLIIFYEISKKNAGIRVTKTGINCINAIIYILVIGAFIFIQVKVKNDVSFHPMVVDESGKATVLEKLFHGRHVIWWETTKYFSTQNLMTRMLGIDLGTEYLHNSMGDRMHSMYFKTLYSVGYIGVLFLTAFVTCTLKNIIQCKDKVISYVTVALLFVFLFMGLTIESLELTQMSWYMMLFCGAIVTMNKKGDGTYGVYKER